MKLKPNQVCPYKDSCKYHAKMGGVNFCQGANPNRKNEFSCVYVNDSGQFIGEGTARSVHDVTGKMEFLQD